jgi:hypothetical protein
MVPWKTSSRLSPRVATAREGLELVEGTFGGVALLVGPGVEPQWLPAGGALRGTGLLLVELLWDRRLDPPAA